MALDVPGARCRRKRRKSAHARTEVLGDAPLFLISDRLAYERKPGIVGTVPGMPVARPEFAAGYRDTNEMRSPADPEYDPRIFGVGGSTVTVRLASLTVVFYTYQSIEAVSKAPKTGLLDFDLIVRDEAHRTTGVTLSGEDESGFVKVHDAASIKGTKRLYMTATPRIYGDEAETKAKEATAELASMDDEALFGKEIHLFGFGEAVGNSLLADYKVLVLAVDEKYVRSVSPPP